MYDSKLFNRWIFACLLTEKYEPNKEIKNGAFLLRRDEKYLIIFEICFHDSHRTRKEKGKINKVKINQSLVVKTDEIVTNQILLYNNNNNQ